MYRSVSRRGNVIPRTRQTTEVYYILEGTGKIELNGDWHDLEPGTTIWIEPGTRHRVVSEEGLKTIVFALPAFDAAPLATVGCTVAGYTSKFPGSPCE